MSQATEALLDKMVAAIVNEVDPEQVILFGSRARGDATADSDVDLVVVEAQPFGAGREIAAPKPCVCGADLIDKLQSVA